MPLARSKRSDTGGHPLLPAASVRAVQWDVIDMVALPPKAFLHWTFGRDTVIWRIWPAVLMHTCFAAAVVTLSLRYNIALDFPPVLLTVLGVVIGFVISYRAMSGYDRYWMGRTAWSDLMRNSRTLGRLIWFHVPLRLSPKTPEETDQCKVLRPVEEMRMVMEEKRIALNLIEAFAVALKHHLRGEKGIYYEDLYRLVQDLHTNQHRHHHAHRHARQSNSADAQTPTDAGFAATGPAADDGVLVHPQPTYASPEAQPAPQLHPTDREPTPHAESVDEAPASHEGAPAPSHNGSTPTVHISSASLPPSRSTSPDPVIPPINAYGAITPGTPHLHRLGHTLVRSASAASSRSRSSCSSDPERRPLLPSATVRERDALFASVSGDLIPFASVWHAVGNVVRRPFHRARAAPAEDAENGNGNVNGEDAGAGAGTGRGDESDDEEGQEGGGEGGGVGRRWRYDDGSDEQHMTHRKHRPRIAGGGENLPLECMRSLSSWFATLEERGSVPGTSLGTMVAVLSSFEDSLSTTERILTTPLPFVYSVHISTVWIYLFFFPFQLIAQFGWYTILGVSIAAFIYLGLVAAGEEIEQPFGYDENDLDLDMFCSDVVHADLERLRNTPGTNIVLDFRELHRAAVAPTAAVNPGPSGDGSAGVGARLSGAVGKRAERPEDPFSRIAQGAGPT